MASELTRNDYSVGWICAIPIELSAVLAVLDEVQHPQIDVPDSDTNIYKFGRIGRHNIVITWLPDTRYGTTQAGIVATRMRSTFTKLRFGLMVGVGGGAPRDAPNGDIRLGDVVISQPSGGSGGVVQYDFGKAMENGEFQRTGALNAPPSILLKAIAAMKAVDDPDLGRLVSETAREINSKTEDSKFRYPGVESDRLFRPEYNHVTDERHGADTGTCESCDPFQAVSRKKRRYKHPYFHYGIIASGNQVMKNGVKRDIISAQTGALCFEMEAAGLMDDFPCIVVRGICDYSDGHKNKVWQPYAALVAAIYAKELVMQIPAASKRTTGLVMGGREKIEKFNLIIPFQMPFRRNPTFTGRVEELDRIHDHLVGSSAEDTPSILAVTGTGGMGKTQIAIEYAHRYHHDYTSIFWVPAANEDSIRSSFINIMQRIVDEQRRITWPETMPDYGILGSKLNIPGLIDDRGMIVANPSIAPTIQAALFRWFQVPGNNRWLLIFDNADDLESFPIQDYFPNHGGGSILVTSRRPEFGHSGEQIDLDGLDENSAVELLLKLARLSKAGDDIRNEAVTLVKQLGFMPLAIGHAASYIYETKASPGEYLTYYNKSFMSLQSIKPTFGWNYRNDTAATTWEISFAEIERQDESAASFLLTCSYFNPQEIYETLWGDDEDVRFQNKRRIRLLASYSLIRVIRSGVFSVHPVVHSWARERLDKTERLKAVKRAVQVLGDVGHTKNVSRENRKWSLQEVLRIITHLNYLHQNFEPEFADIFVKEEQAAGTYGLFAHYHNIGMIFDDRGKYDEAMLWYQRSLVGKEKILDKHHKLILSTRNAIAITLDNQGKYDEALTLYQETLAGIPETDEETTDRLKFDLIHNIALIFRRQEKYDDALEWYGRALAGYEKVLGEDHPTTLDTVHNMSIAYQSQRKYDEAMKLLKKALTGREKTLHEYHPDLFSTVHEIAKVLNAQGKYSEAVEWFDRALSGYETVYGEEHLDIYSTLNSMGIALYNQREYDKAIALYNRSLEGREKLLPKTDSQIYNTVFNIGQVYKSQKKYKEALPWFHRALDGYEKALGKDHQFTKDAAWNIDDIEEKTKKPSIKETIVSKFRKDPAPAQISDSESEKEEEPPQAPEKKLSEEKSTDIENSDEKDPPTKQVIPAEPKTLKGDVSLPASDQESTRQEKAEEPTENDQPSTATPEEDEVLKSYEVVPDSQGKVYKDQLPTLEETSSLPTSPGKVSSSNRSSVVGKKGNPVKKKMSSFMSYFKSH
ncbi:hypothetical protein TWF730_008935 [Orbilia blumenaviensis]|uniref:NB-ARC domain-containing protein n=1 Tax=Orbilia blumenaviensis TaxID=1796055 RepID=A0AAV9V044_9PEZI